MTKQDLSSLIKRLIEKEINNQADTYTHNGSTWIIFTDEKKWVIELTKEKTLWYNYYFFTKIFKLIGLDIVENQHYITKWVEDTIINPVKRTEKSLQIDGSCVIEDTIQNGVKKTKRGILVQELSFEGVIENGVKNTYSDKIPHDYDWSDQFTEEIDDIIENGVKETSFWSGVQPLVEDVIQSGIKETRPMDEWVNSKSIIEKTIKEGVKKTTAGGYLGFVEKEGKKIHQFETAKQLYYVEDVIDSGIKKTEGGVLFDESKIDTVIIEGVKETKCAKDKDIYDPHTFVNQKFEREMRVKEVIDNGIKEVQPLPAQDGNRDWGNYYHRQEDRTKPHTQYVDDVIKNGYLCD